MPNKPSKKILDRALSTIKERYEASSNIVNSKKSDWKRYYEMYESEQQATKYDWESNLVIPKADYVVETITPRIMNTVFSVEEWLTVKTQADINTQKRIQKALLWVLDKKVNFYLTALELFKAAPIYGTSICKTHMRNGWPAVEYIPIDQFYPDAYCNKPGQIQEMRYCFHRFKRDINQLYSYSINNQLIYFNLDQLEQCSSEELAMEGTDTVVDDKTKVYSLIEHWGEFEYEKGKHEEYIITAAIDGEDGSPFLIIRCEPSKLFHKDRYTNQNIYLKPFVSCLYSINPGQFYGKGAIQSIESLANEQTELHNLYMDNHKRLVNGIVKARNRSQLTEDDIQFKPGVIWWLDQLDDVEVVTYPEINITPYSVIHGMLDREIEKASGVTSESMGVGRTKRQTLGEFSGLRNEANERFRVFIQMADRLTLRPIIFRVLLLLNQSINLLNNNTIDTGTENVQITSEELLLPSDFTFAATAVETEFSKYNKQQVFPRILKELVALSEVSGTRINFPEIMNELGDLFNIKNPERFTIQEPMIPLKVLPPELQRTVVEAMQVAQMEVEQQKRTKAMAR